MNFIFSWQKTIFYERAQRGSKIFFCHSKIKFISSSRRVMFFLLYRHNDIDKIIEGNYQITSSINSRVRLWKINHSGPGWSFYQFYEWYIFPASSSGASFFAWQRRARNEWLVMNRKGPWEGYRRQAKRLPDLVSFSWQKSRFLGTAQFLVFLSLGSDQF